MQQLQPQLDASAKREAEAQKRVAAAHERIADLERDNLCASHKRLRGERELFKRRIFIAKAERADNEQQLGIEFAVKLRELNEIADTLGIANDEDPKRNDEPAKDGKPNGKRGNNRGTGRRNLRDLALPEDRVETVGPHLEQLVAEDKVVLLANTLATLHCPLRMLQLRDLREQPDRATR